MISLMKPRTSCFNLAMIIIEMDGKMRIRSLIFKRYDFESDKVEDIVTKDLDVELQK